MSEVFSGKPGKLVELPETNEGFGSLLEGVGDEYPEGAFYMTGNLKEAFEQGRKMAEMTTKWDWLTDHHQLLCVRPLTAS